MINIYLHQENTHFLNCLKEKIYNIILIENFDMSIISASTNYQNLIDFNSKTFYTGIYLLEITALNYLDVLHFTQKIRNYDPRGFIIFITSYTQVFPLIFEYKVEVLDCICKLDLDFICSRIRECLLKINNLYMNNTAKLKFFKVYNKDKLILEHFKNIYSFGVCPTVSHKICMHTTYKSFEFYSNLNHIQTMLDNRFYRCNNSTIVNLDKIVEIDKLTRTLYLDNYSSYSYSTRKGADLFLCFKHLVFNQKNFESF